ncbi:MAG: hypothetical protein QW757_05915, partial [Candidatus Woesearchaeota archaeon]
MKKALKDRIIKNDYWYEYVKKPTTLKSDYWWLQDNKDTLIKLNYLAFRKFYLRPSYIIKSIIRKQSI